MYSPPLPRSQQPRSIAESSVCFDCDLHSKCRYNCLAGEGMRGTIMLVGQKPEGGDIAAQRPFRGDIGRKVNFLLERAGLHRDAIYLTHAVKCDIPSNKKPTKKYLQACRPHLIEEIRWVRPKIIVTMGTEALQQIAPWAGSADDWRGFPIPIHNSAGKLVCYCIPTLSPKQALNDPTSDPILIRDLKLAKRMLKDKWLPPAMDFKVKTITNIDELKVLAKKLIQSDSWAFDLETKGFKFLRDIILCASFSIDGKQAYVVPIDKEFRVDGVERNWEGMERELVINILKKIFLSKAKKAAQGGKFDLKWLKAYGISVRNFDFDTLLAHHLVDSEKPHDLTFIAQWYGLIHEKYDAALEEAKKLVGNDYSKIDCDTLYYYAGIDAAVTKGLRPILEAELIKTGTRKVFDDIAMKLNPLLADMEYQGVRIDLVEMNKIIVSTDEGIAQYSAEICELLKIDEFKPNATKEIKAFFTKKRIRLTKKTPSGAFSYDEEVLKSFKNNSKVGVLCTAVLKLRELSKLKTTYLDGNGKRDNKTGELKGMRNRLDANHFIHSNFLIHGTYTGRLASAGPNLQNIPKKHGIRQLFIPDCEEDIFMDVDYRQLEVRIAAGISKDATLIREICQGVDMHSRNASQFLMQMREDEFLAVMADKTHELYKEYSEKRRAAKCVTFGVLYGSTANGVAVRENIPVEDCELFIKRFFQKYDRLYSWIKSQHQRVYDTHKIISPTGRMVKFHDLEWAMSEYCSDFDKRRRMSEVQRISVNMPVQGYGSDIFQSKCIELYHYMRKKKMESRFKLTIHDGFILNVKPNEKHELKEIVPVLMKTHLNKGTNHEVPLEVDIAFTDKWEGETINF